LSASADPDARRTSPAGDVAALEQRIGHVFADPELARTALTHASFAAESRGAATHYERLEFLGDAVVGAVVSEDLYRTRSEAAEGGLARTRASVVSAPALAAAARAIDLGPLIRLGVGEARAGGREREAILADVLEAVVGAVFVDAGFDAARPVVLRLLAPTLGQLGDTRIVGRDAKSALQEYTQARWKETPQYRLDAAEGPEHAREFVVSVLVQGESAGEGRANRKRDAEQIAARNALRALTTARGANKP
jgi:ribonuclease-3